MTQRPKNAPPLQSKSAQDKCFKAGAKPPRKSGNENIINSGNFEKMEKDPLNILKF